MTRKQTVGGLEQDLKDRYPDAQVTVTDQGGSVTVAVSQSNDSIRLKIDTDRIRAAAPCSPRFSAAAPNDPYRILIERTHESRT